jgi:carbonic anhydrase
MTAFGVVGMESFAPPLCDCAACLNRHGILRDGNVVRVPVAHQPNRNRDLTPAEALKVLLDGNRRFAEGTPTAPHRDLVRLREVAPGQKPYAAVIGCADSRVPVEIVFDQGLGDLFVTRIAGNVATPECIGSLEFGTEVLGAKVLFVLGHTNCGAVAAALNGDAVPGQISVLFDHIQPAILAANGDAAKAVRENVRVQAAALAKESPVIAGLIREGRLIVAGGVYDLATGRVEPVEV